MAVFKATKNKSDSGGIFKATERKSYDSNVVYDWETRNKNSITTLNQYRDKINNGGYLSSDDITAYRKALDDYIDSTSNLRRFNSIFGDISKEDDEEDWNATVSSLESGYKGISDYFSNFETEDDFNTHLASMKQQDEMKDVDLNALSAELEGLRKQREERDKIQNELSRKQGLAGGYSAAGQYYATEDGQNQIAELERQLAAYGGLDDDLAQKEKYFRDASRLQNGIRLASVVANDDFQQYADIGAAIENPTIPNNFQSRNPADWQRFEDEAYKSGNAVAWERGNMGGETHAYDFMTPQEVSIYNYYLGKGDRESADLYLDSIMPDLNTRRANETFGFLKDKPLLEMLFGVEAGLDQFTSGLIGFGDIISGNHTYKDPTHTQITSGMVREDLKDVDLKWYNFKEGQWNDANVFGNSLGQLGYDTVTTTANMAPSILASTAIGLVNPVAGAVTGNALLGASAAGNAYQEKLNLGYSSDEARSYGLMVGTSEAVLQYLLGGIGKLGKGGLTSNVIKSLDAADNVFARFAKSAGGKLLLNASKEAIEEGLQSIIEPYLWQAVSGVEASVDWQETFYNALMGFVTSGAIEGGGAAIGAAVKNAQYKQVGQNIMAAEGGVDALKNLANEVSGVSDTKTQKSLAKQADNVSSEIAAGKGLNNLVAKAKNARNATKVGRLYDTVKTANNTANASANQADIAKSLQRKGFNAETANDIAEALVASNNGQELTEAQGKLLKSVKNSKVVQEAISNIMDNEQSTMGRRSQNIRNFADDVKAGTIAKAKGVSVETAKEMMKQKPTSAKKIISDGHYEVSADGKTTVDGKETTLDGFRKMQDGSIAVATEDGQTADPSKVTYANKNHALIYENYANIETTTDNPVIASMDVDDRSALAMSYDPSSGVDGKVFFLGSNHAFWYGFEGISIDEKTLPNNSPVRGISKEQRDFAYALGKKAGKKAAETQEAGVKAAYEKAVEKLGGKEAAEAVAKKNEGEVVLEDNIRESSMTNKQKASYKMAGIVAKAVGTTIHVYHGFKEYGKYDTSTGEIWLNINGNFKGSSMMAFTLAHELLHMAKQWKSADFKAFADYLFEQYGKKGVSVERLIHAQMVNAKANEYTLNEHEAYEEVIADACMRMLLDSDALEKMATYREQNPDNWHKIIDAIKKFIDNIRKVFKGAEPDAEEAHIYKELDDVVKKELEDRFVNMVMDAGEHLSTIRNAFGKGTVVEVNADGEFTLAKGEVDGATKFLYNDYTWDRGGRDTLEAALKAEGFSKDDINAALTIMDGKHNLVKELAEQFPEQDRINQATITTDLKDGHSVLSALVSNGDYPVNIDLLMVCKKRKAYQRVINRLCETGLIQQATVDALAIAEINKILGKYGFETACLGCFVESRRLRIQEWAETIVKERNTEVKKRNPNAKAFGFGKGEATLTPDEVMQLVGELEGHEKNDKGNLNLGQGSAVKRMGVLLDKVPSLRKTLSVEDLITPDGLTALRKFDSNLFSMVKSRYGSNSPKFVQEFNPYNHELAKYGKVPSEYKNLREYLYAIGGARMQSFSDFIVENWFDYCQIVADLAARKLPMHTYTKEISLAKLFGLTGIKINMSLIPDIDRSLGKEYAGLTRNANGELELIWADKDRFKATGGKSYMQSINFADAIALQNDPRYSSNVGTIAVGVSDNHILMMLDDNRIRMIIPYHSSGMNPIFADLMGTSYYKDYTMVQNTTVKQLYNSKGQKVSLKLDKTQIGKLTSGFQFNEVLQELGDARAAAQAYKEWCADASKHTITIKGETYTAELTPKFNDFSNHENYYKLLEDFNTYDCISEEAARQGDVQQIYPEDFDQILKGELTAQEKHRQKQEESQAFDKAMGEIESYLSTHTKADTVFYAEQHGINLGAKDKKLGAADKSKLADLRKGMKMSMPKVDSEGRQLSVEQQEFFKDSQVRWGENLMPVYHGTRKEFTVFDATKGYDENRVGGLLWAAKDSEYAEGFTSLDEPLVMKGYLNITNLLDVGAIDSYDNYDKRLQEIADLVKLTPSELEAMVTYDNPVIYDITSSKGFRDRIVELGYDGVEAQESGLQTFGFVDSNQFKNIDNKKPTTDPDIRYSMPKKNAGNKNKNRAISGSPLTRRSVKQRSVGSTHVNMSSTAAADVLGISNIAELDDSVKSVIAKLGELFVSVDQHKPVLGFKRTIDAGNLEGSLVALGILKREGTSGSAYRYDNGHGLRISNHSAHTENFVGDGEHLSIALFERGKMNAFVEGESNVIEAVFRRSYLDNNPESLKRVIHDIANFIVTGEYHDTAGALRYNFSGTDSFKEQANQRMVDDKIAREMKLKAHNSRGMSPRQLLADAFDELVQTPDERKLMDQYRNNITKVEGVQDRLTKLRGEISKLTKAKGDKAKISELSKTAKELAELIDKYDRKLLELEASKPLRDVLARARSAAYQEARQRNEETLKEYRQQVSERFDRGVEGRRKTEMRKNIRKVIRDLDKILNRGDKKRNVKEDMKDFVAEALSAAEVLFTDNYTNEDIVHNGFGVELSKEETKYLEEARKYMDELANLPAGGYDVWQARRETEEKLKSKLAYRMSKLNDAFFRERQRLNKAEVAGVLGKLADAYAKLETSEYAYVNGAYHEAVYEYLKMLQEDVGGAKVKDMTLSQLEELYKAYTMVLTTVQNANKMFADDLKMSKEELANRVMMEVYQAGGEHGLWSKGELSRNQASWNNTKPIYAAERTGSSTFVNLVKGLFKGQYKWATDMEEAKAFRKKVAEKYGFKSWDMEKTYKFTSSSGIEFELNLNQIMALYAYAKREQAHDHLLKGGFVFGKNTEVVVTKNGIKRTYLNKSAKAHNISNEIMGEIVSKLSAEQKGFVDEMQDYLSSTMGEKGNEVSMRLYGVKLFMEKFYFPLRSAGQFKEKAKEAELKQQQGQISIANSGFTHATTPKASNPVVLDGFTDVWASHVNEMSLYHSMVLPMEDFRRVYNYASPNMEGQESASVNSFIENAYGDAATGYFDQLYKELNGGAIVDPRENLSKQMISRFKKASVMLSNSVVVQQFSAIGRACALIDPKYFIGAKVDKKRHAALWNEMKQYAPVAIIKEMGGFDTHTGLNAKDYLLAEEYGKGERIKGFAKDEQYRSEIMGVLPAKADELTWCAIWEAVKRETKAKNDKMDVKSDEFLKMAGERFSEVIEKTQVYDSVLARSANMRSKNGMMQMLTAFMAEPTTTINMVEDALRKGDKKYIAKTFGAVAVSIILNNMLASAVYAMRDDDEDETFLEKYSQSFASGMLDDINPMTYYPVLKDIWSLFQGYDVERTDMAIYSDIVDSAKKVVSLIAKYDSVGDNGAEKYYKDIGDALMSLLDAGASAFGIPWKNIRRDIMSYFNTYNTFTSGASTTWNSFTDAVGDAVLDSVPIVGWVAGESKGDKLYDAIVSGDKTYLSRLKNTYKTDTAYQSAVRKALRENDPRIKEAAKAVVDGRAGERAKIAKEIEAEGHFSLQDIQAAINAEVDKLRKEARGK